MSYKVKTVSSFDREAKKVSRKHPSIKSDIVSETVILAEIYLKNEYDTVDVDLVIKRLRLEGVI